jgi:hypothetical protein
MLDGRMLDGRRQFRLGQAVLFNLLAFTPLLIAVALLAASAARGWPARRGTERRLARRFVSIARLRGAILGCGGKSVEAILGPPKTISAPGDTWYYPLSERDHSIITVIFRDGAVKDVELFQGIPGISRSPLNSPGQGISRS